MACKSILHYLMSTVAISYYNHAVELVLVCYLHYRHLDQLAKEVGGERSNYAYLPIVPTYKEWWAVIIKINNYSARLPTREKEGLGTRLQCMSACMILY